MSPQVVIIGAPGAGKSTVGALLAQSLGSDFLDSDEIIQLEQGKSISDIFIESSEQYFREIEKTVVLNLLRTKDGVISLGGGSVLDEDVQHELARHKVVWLKISLSDAVERVGLNQSRPLLLGNVRSNMKKLLENRNHVYERLATIILEAANSPQVIVRAVLEKLQVK